MAKGPFKSGDRAPLHMNRFRFLLTCALVTFAFGLFLSYPPVSTSRQSSVPTTTTPEPQYEHGSTHGLITPTNPDSESDESEFEPAEPHTHVATPEEPHEHIGEPEEPHPHVTEPMPDEPHYHKTDSEEPYPQMAEPIVSHVQNLSSTSLSSSALPKFTFPPGSSTPASSAPVSNNESDIKPGETSHASKQTILAKVSMLYGERNDYYERSVKSHERHANRLGYPVHVLRNDVASRYWNKPTYLLSLLIQELVKDPGDRVQWLMWFDADSILINPALQVEVFLPPPDFPDVHFLATKDQNGLNTGIFFVRVHEWSVMMFEKTLAYPLFKPEVDLGFSADQIAMEIIFNETDFSSHVLYQPRIWYNTYEFHHGYEGLPGNLLVHFPGLEEERWSHMSDWLNVVEGPEAANWEVAFESTMYPQQIERFWSHVRDCQSTLASAEAYVNEKTDVPEYVLKAVDRLRVVLRAETDQVDAMNWAVEGVQRAIEYHSGAPFPST